MKNKPAGPPQAPVKSLLRKAAPVLLVLAVVEGITVATIYSTERSQLKRDMFKSYPVGDPYSDRYEMSVPGVKQPPVQRADQARLNDAEDVIGIEVRGLARAYRLAAMKGREQHIINDLVAGVPVSITYCDVTECVRAFTGKEGEPPLDIWQGGLKGNRMVLTIGGISYIQDTAEALDSTLAGKLIPFEPFPATRTTWKAWRSAHPDTEIYEGAVGDDPT